ncbi:hypothetical protein A33K_17893 [Burkholderia humptydooensis MSMB43]|uniref:Uncharacterized protein n=1 Tax=Burkholderia humptydooensis MSMB43 TaxID=441157 RepID=A0ABN0FZD9_9BURK|nr:hypothetical protein A33K_17893 [Burkholderia humptydooensis MSMB43]
MVARKNPVQPTNCDKRLRKYDTSVQVLRTTVSDHRRKAPESGMTRRSARRAAATRGPPGDARPYYAREAPRGVCAAPHRAPDFRRLIRCNARFARLNRRRGRDIGSIQSLHSNR